MFLKFLFDTEMHSFYYVLCSEKIYIFTENVYPKITLREKGYWEGLAELENSKSPDNAPENFMAAKQTGNCSARKRVLEGACGTGIGGYICQKKKVV